MDLHQGAWTELRHRNWLRCNVLGDMYCSGQSLATGSTDRLTALEYRGIPYTPAESFQYMIQHLQLLRFYKHD
jgi:hypothetical protein